MSTIYCHGEPGRFPDAEFLRDKYGKLHVPYIHFTEVPHYSTGELVAGGTDPGIAALVLSVLGRAVEMDAAQLRASLGEISKKAE